MEHSFFKKAIEKQCEQDSYWLAGFKANPDLKTCFCKTVYHHKSPQICKLKKVADTFWKSDHSDCTMLEDNM